MSNTAWNLDQADGTLTVHTGVTGRAARMGHRLTIEMQSWRIGVDWAKNKPVSAQLVVDVDSLQVVDGEGGLTPLTGPEKALARANALKTLDAKHFPQIEFRTETITPAEDGYRLHGPLEIRGVSRPFDIDLAVTEDANGRRLSCTAEVSQKAFGIRPYSMALGAMRVADAVTVSFTAQHPG